jgi:hypothetical protein
VKSRSSDTSVLKKRRFIANVRMATFEVRDDLYMLFVVVDRSIAKLSWDPFGSFPARNLQSIRPCQAELH